jgi:ABC-type multidrug transport system fused ATPase/permease subunit
MADVLSEIAFLPSLNKYITEVAIILGALLISAIQFVTQDAANAFATLAVFLAAGTRVAPAVLRIQQGQLTIRVNTAAAMRALDLIEELDPIVPLSRTSDDLTTNHDGFVPNISVKGVEFKYKKSEVVNLSNVNLEIAPGEMVAITGPSGAGKTTLIDVILGVLEPSSGSVKISGESPLEVVKNWPGAIAYVPQDSKIIAGTIKKNICMGYPEDEVSDELVWDAIRISQLEDFVKELPFGIHTEITENGSSMSGGQRQRLGIARALISKPKLIVLDEATSALDGETEQRVAQAIKSLRGMATILIIAHRLSSVRDSDKVCYIEKGSIICSGSFTEVKEKVPAFETQAKLMGL